MSETNFFAIMGAIQAEWTEACERKCGCGRLICYDAYMSGEELCVGCWRVYQDARKPEGYQEVAR